VQIAANLKEAPALDASAQFDLAGAGNILLVQIVKNLPAQPDAATEPGRYALALRFAASSDAA
jgi:hypothetical protein